MSWLLDKLSSIRLSLQSWLLASGSLILTILLVVIQYKNRKIHKLQLEILSKLFDTKITENMRIGAEASKKANNSYNKYMESRAKYEERHGKI